MKETKLNLLLTLLYAGWGPVPAKSSRNKGILALQKGDTVVKLRKRVAGFFLYKKGVPICQVVTIAYQYLRFDPYDPFTLTDLPPLDCSFNLKEPEQGLIRNHDKNHGKLLEIHDLLCELTAAMRGAPNKSTLISFLKPCLNLSWERINRLLRDGQNHYWTVRKRKRRTPGSGSIHYHPFIRGNDEPTTGGKAGNPV